MPFKSTLRRDKPLADPQKPPLVDRQNVKQLSDILDPLLGDREIRLIKLKRAAREDDARLEIDIQSFHLDEDTIPAFSALSYTWRSGSPSTDEQLRATAFVSYNDAPYAISGNLYLALGFLRRRDDADLWLWVDQLCIRQSDPQEKSRQIPLMRRIYQRASWVKAWVGGEEGFVPVLLRYMSWVVGERLWDCGRFDLGDEMNFGDSRNLGKGVRALVGFLAKPWFSRVWVVQEATSSQGESLTLHFNEFSVRFATLMTAVDHTNRLLIRANPSTSVTDGGRITWFSFLWACPALRAVGGPGFETLQELMQKFCTWDCSLEVDKVYALLGLASDSSLYAPPDYSLTSEQVFRQVSATWMRHGIVNVLSSLTFAVAGRGRNGRLPSWAVDWSRFSSKHPVKPWRNNYKFAAGGRTDANAPYTFDGDRLALRGVVVDRIAAVSRLCRPGAFARGDWTESALSLIREQRRSSSLEHAEDDIALDLGRLLVLDGQSSLYEFSGEEDKFSGQVIRHDLAAFDWHHLRPVYSSHQVASWCDMPRAPYYTMNAEHLGSHFDNASSWLDLLQMSDEAMDDLMSTRPRNTSAQAAYRDAVIAVNMDQQLFRTEKGRLGIGKWGVRPEDEIVVLEGGRMPFIARKRGEGDLHGRRLVSEAYVRGMMHGETIPDGSAWNTIEIV